MAEAPVTLIVLAGQRAGTLNALAARAGVSHKCLVPIRRVPPHSPFAARTQRTGCPSRMPANASERCRPCASSKVRAPGRLLTSSVTSVRISMGWARVSISRPGG